MEQAIYFEDYELGHVRTTYGRTSPRPISSSMPAHTGDFFPTHGRRICQDPALRPAHRHGTMVFSIGVGLEANLINPVAFPMAMTGCASSVPSSSATRSHAGDDCRQGGRSETAQCRPGGRALRGSQPARRGGAGRRPHPDRRQEGRLTRPQRTNALQAGRCRRKTAPTDQQDNDMATDFSGNDHLRDRGRPGHRRAIATAFAAAGGTVTATDINTDALASLAAWQAFPPAGSTCWRGGGRRGDCRGRPGRTCSSIARASSMPARYLR